MLRRNPDKAETDDPFAELHRDILSLWESAPAPQNVPFGDGTRTHQVTAATIAVGWGWLVRIIRTGELAILLEKSGFAVETGPLMRSIIEHTIRLAHASDFGFEAVEVGLRERSRSLEKLKKAQTSGWFMSADQLEDFDGMQAEASEDFRHLDSHAHLAHVVKHYPGLGQLHMAWLIETQVSHPTLISAPDYFERRPASNSFELRTRAKESDTCIGAQVCITLLVALKAYAHIAGTSSFFKEPLKELDERMESLGRAYKERLADESPF